jgi:N-acetylglucosamine-6-phosphate deacetylase
MRLTGRDPSSGRTLRVTVEDGRIGAIQATDEPAELWLAPGLVDLQVNGFAGHDVNAPDVDEATVAALVRSLHRAGVTTVVPTVISAPEERIIAALSAIARARAADPLVAHAIPYAHLEGPFLSVEDGPRGAHDRRHVRPADVGELRRWGDLAGMVTVSPHDEAAIDLIGQATRMGVRCAIGHTHATPEQITRAADAGATLSTHLGNATYALLPRHPNHLWNQLADDRLHAGFIADGHHLPAETFRAMLRAKGVERAHLVSDATSLAGLPPGRYRTPVGGEVELSETGRLSHVGTPFLAGASRSLADGVATAIAMADLTLSTGLRLASANPGRFVGGRGVLRTGAPADLITFAWRPGDRTLDVRTVVAAGRAVWEA